ncbi:hypothetical protein L0337_05270 [candidate division KSB1 bacterium]|nr:hypothetical protein [candidate division KSB1 bacterium]
MKNARRIYADERNFDGLPGGNRACGQIAVQANGSFENGTPPSTVRGDGAGDLAGSKIAGFWVEIRRTGHIK